MISPNALWSYLIWSPPMVCDLTWYNISQGSVISPDMISPNVLWSHLWWSLLMISDLTFHLSKSSVISPSWSLQMLYDLTCHDLYKCFIISNVVISPNALDLTSCYISPGRSSPVEPGRLTPSKRSFSLSITNFLKRFSPHLRRRPSKRSKDRSVVCRLLFLVSCYVLCHIMSTP